MATPFILPMSYIAIGKVLGTWGLKGDIKVSIDTDFIKERYKKGSYVYICDKDDYIRFTVDSYKQDKNHLILKFKEINDINDIEKYIGQLVYKDKADIKPLKDGEYYFHELYDLDVLVDDTVIGKVIAVEPGVAHNYLRIRKSDGKTSLVPFIPIFIKAVDKKKGIVDIIKMDGLL